MVMLMIIMMHNMELSTSGVCLLIELKLYYVSRVTVKMTC